MKIGVVLSGCGFQDGAEIQEAVFTLYFLDQLGVEVISMAPNINQANVVNHLSGEKTNEVRNVLVESARITRGNIIDIKDVNHKELDAVIFPGGFGAALSLSSFATEGADCTVNPDVEKLILDIHNADKPLGFICIAPVIAAKVLGKLSEEHKLKLTIGTSKDVADKIHEMHAVHDSKVVSDIETDLENKVVSTPAYMLGPGPKDVAKGIEKLVHQVVAMVEAGRAVHA